MAETVSVNSFQSSYVAGKLPASGHRIAGVCSQGANNDASNCPLVGDELSAALYRPDRHLDVAAQAVDEDCCKNSVEQRGGLDRLGAQASKAARPSSRSAGRQLPRSAASAISCARSRVWASLPGSSSIRAGCVGIDLQHVVELIAAPPASCPSACIALRHERRESSRSPRAPSPLLHECLAVPSGQAAQRRLAFVRLRPRPWGQANDAVCVVPAGPPRSVGFDMQPADRARPGRMIQYAPVIGAGRDRRPSRKYEVRIALAILRMKCFRTMSRGELTRWLPGFKAAECVTG